MPCQAKKWFDFLSGRHCHQNCQPPFLAKPMALAKAETANSGFESDRAYKW
jgi:hypothetical protein